MDAPARYAAERDAALSSLDEGRIRGFYREWTGNEPPAVHLVFWGGVHKSITACRDLPIEFRRASKRWLEGHGWQSLDDGEL